MVLAMYGETMSTKQKRKLRGKALRLWTRIF